MKTIILFLCVISICYPAQFEAFKYKRQLHHVKDSWQRIVLPDSIFQHLTRDCRDIRLIGVNAKDTITIPYLFRIAHDKLDWTVVDYVPVKKSFNEDNAFIFEVPGGERINRIELNSSEKYYDWVVSVEGSNNQKNWAQIVEKARVMVVQEGQTDFTYNTINFSHVSTCRYYRVKVQNANIKLFTLNAVFSEYSATPMETRLYNPVKIITKQDKINKRTIVSVQLPVMVPVSQLRLTIRNKVDFIRTVEIESASDSIRQGREWVPRFSHLYSGYISSFDTNICRFPMVRANNFLITIQNDNQTPVSIDSIYALGPVHELIANFPHAAEYYIIYGNDTIKAEDYPTRNWEGMPKDGLEEVQVSCEAAFASPKIQPSISGYVGLFSLLIISIVSVLYYLHKKDKGSK
ncbi:MAG: DUF3999 family protein [Ignavibacteria bacterium]|nr:DUF3999 family protein [Ignavibacteria bacterium]